MFSEPSPSNEKATEKYPYVVVQKSGKKVPVVQAYAYTKYLGKLMVTFDDAGNVISAKGNPIQLDYMIKKGIRSLYTIIFSAVFCPFVVFLFILFFIF